MAKPARHGTRTQARRPQLTPQASARTRDTWAPPGAWRSEEALQEAGVSLAPQDAERDEAPAFGVGDDDLPYDEAPTDVAPRQAPALTHTEFTPHDADALWDLCRLDPEGVRAFLGALPTLSLELHRYLDAVAASQAQGRALLRTAWRGDTRLGFLFAFPITDADAKCHIYLVPEQRGQLSTLLPWMIEAADAALSGRALKVVTTNPDYARFLSTFGFTQAIVCTRPSRHRSQGVVTDGHERR